MTQSDQKNFIETNAKAFARFAFGGYQEAGKGVVVALPEEMNVTPGEVNTGHFYYLRVGGLQEFCEQWMDPSRVVRIMHRVDEAVSEYDPMAEIVVVFSQSDAINVHRVEPSTPPPIAYAAYTN